MKKFRKYWLILCLLWLLPQPIKLATMENVDFALQEQKDFLYKIDALMSQLSLNDQATIEIQLYRLNDQRLLSDILLIGEEEAGNYQMHFNYYQYDEEGQINQIPIKLLIYQNFSLVYINLFEILWQSGFFENEHFAGADLSQFSHYLDSYVLIEQENQLTQILTSLFFLPDINQIAEIQQENIYQLNDYAMLSLDRLEIPRFFYAQAGQFQLKYDLQMRFQLDETTKEVIAFTSQHELLANQQANGLEFSFHLASQDSEGIFTLPNLLREETSTQYEWEGRVESQAVSDKIIEAFVIFNPLKQLYHTTITGLNENLNFNLFNEETVYFEANNLRLIYNFMPSQRPILAMDAIQRYSLTEFDYIIQSLITQ